MNDARDPIAEQNEAARVFEERTGRKSTDPAPPGVMNMRRRPDGSLEVHTYGYDRDPNDDFDPFERAGIDRVHHAPAEIDTPTAVFGRFPHGTNPRSAVGEVFAVMFPTGQIIGEPEKFPDAIDADVVEDPDPNHWASWDAPEVSDREPCLSDEAFERMAGEDPPVPG